MLAVYGIIRPVSLHNFTLGLSLHIRDSFFYLSRNKPTKRKNVYVTLEKEKENQVQCNTFADISSC